MISKKLANQLKKLNTLEFLLSSGRFVFHPVVIDAVEHGKLKIDHLLQKHFMGEWGAVDEAVKTANDLALQSGGEINSAYLIDKSYFIKPTDPRLLIQTNAERTQTIVTFACL